MKLLLIISALLLIGCSKDVPLNPLIGISNDSLFLNNQFRGTRY